ncbi:MAG: M20/M25/M40 family metallo-hydrolase [Armatimonadetes bacterium]|nr:M20/M25/M40 family metallo-hydrolase [Armatimonadota bacterium]
MSYSRQTISLILLGFTVMANAQADPAMVDKIVSEGRDKSQVMNHLKFLSKKIGARLSTSESLDKAYTWTQKKFTEYGCKNVHLEQWGEWPVGFQRGKSTGGMVSPEKASFEFTTPSWSEGTHGRKKGFAVYAPTTMAEFEANKAKYKGSWIVYKTSPPRGPRVRPGETPAALTPEQQSALDLSNAINGSGILGKVFGAGGEIVLTSGNFRDKTFEQHPMDVNITIRKSDMAKVVADLDSNKPVELEFDINQKFIKGPRKLYNVVAEIPGTEKPDEIIIVGGHLDSWDGPGSEGASDNGTGTSCAIEIARILKTVGAKPKRTIRFVLFSAEEQGLFGSTAYVKDHAAELGKISAVFIEDNGPGHQSGTYALESMAPFIQPILDINNKAFPDMQMKLRVVARMPRGGASDHSPFNAAGVPAFFWDKTNDFDYNFIHHTQHDTFEMVPAKSLIQCATNEAVAVFLTACQAEMMPRQPAVPSSGTGS